MRVDAEVSEGLSLNWPIAAAGVATGLLVFVGMRSAATTLAYVATATAVTALSFIVLAYNTPGLRRPRRRRRVRADSRGLSVDGELIVPKQLILRTHVRDEPFGGHSVIIEARGLVPTRIVHVSSSRIA